MTSEQSFVDDDGLEPFLSVMRSQAELLMIVFDVFMSWIVSALSTKPEYQWATYYNKNLKNSNYNWRLSFKSRVTYDSAYVTCAKLTSKSVYVHNFDVNQNYIYFTDVTRVQQVKYTYNPIVTMLL